MVMNYYYYFKYPIVVGLLFIILLSCDKDWLDIKADKLQAIPESISDFQATMNGYTTFSSSGSFKLLELASDGHYTTDAAWTSAAQVEGLNAYTWSKESSYGSASSGWNKVYNTIFRTNIVLDGLKRIIPSGVVERQEYQALKGQALYHRADKFFKAAQIWAPPYRAGGTNAELSIPLRLEADVVLPSIRSTVSQTYEVILRDLKEAADLLPNVPTIRTRPSKPAVYALLAKVYLSMGLYEEAEEYADASLNLYSVLMDFNDLSLTTNFIGDFRTNPEVLCHGYMITTGINSFLSTNCFIDPELYNSYAADDLRRDIYFRVNPSGTISFKGNYNNSTASLFCGPATDEMYLIRAECNARAGKVAEAMNDLNDLLRTRWRKDEDGQTTYVDQTAADAEDALDLILAERKKELVLRGVRWTDLRRLNQEDRYKVTLTRTIGGQTYTLEPNSYKYVFPLPDEIIAISGMQQNPGWD